jgi:hypothetical protein
MTEWTVASLIVGVSLIVSSVVIGGRYTVSQAPQGIIYVVDRFTGDVRACNLKDCRRVPWTTLRAEMDDFLNNLKPN